MKSIKLINCEEYVTVSDIDYEHLNQYKWHKDKKGYVRGTVNKQAILMHRYIFLELMKQPYPKIVDHKDNDRNSRENLRPATASQNAKNTTKRQNTSSQYIGVSKKDTRWIALSRYNNKIHREYYDNEHHAAHAYNLILDDQKCDFGNRNTIDKEYLVDFVRYVKPDKQTDANGEILPKGISLTRSNMYRVSCFIPQYKGESIRKIVLFDNLDLAKEHLNEKLKEIETLRKQIRLQKRPRVYNSAGQTVIELFNKNKTKVAETIVDDNLYEKLIEYSWSLSQDNTARGSVNGKMVMLHRYVMNYDGNDLIDHINGNPLDNRRENLRIVTSQENMMNRKSKSGSTSKYVGVSYDKTKKRWKSSIKYLGQTYGSKSFLKEIEAARYRDTLTKKYFGKHGRYNFPEEIEK